MLKFLLNENEKETALDGLSNTSSIKTRKAMILIRRTYEVILQEKRTDNEGQRTGLIGADA